MNLFGLTPDRVMARIGRAGRSGKAIHIPSFKQSLLTGSLGFTCASLVVFATVAFAERWMYRNLGMAGAYLAWTLLFIALGAGLLSPLVIGPARLRRFFPLFAIAFLLYAVGWVGAYFGLHAAMGEWGSAMAGSFAASLLMALVIAVGFGALYTLPRIFVVLLITNSVGYFLGAWLNHAIRGKAGMLLWGLVYGLGFGAGIGWGLYLAQAPVRARLETGQADV